MSRIGTIIPPSDCDEHGVPLDWERCRALIHQKPLRPPFDLSHSLCSTCGGHGSLKAAALDAVRACSRYRNLQWPWFSPHLLAKTDTKEQIEERMGQLEAASVAMDAEVTRCESCFHPMSEGTWAFEGPTWTDEDIELGLMSGGASNRFYSACDERCEHDRVGRYRRGEKLDAGARPWRSKGEHPRPSAGWEVEASWRPVAVRTLGWPHDLRLENLAVLCLRCYADRGAEPASS